MQRDPVCLVPFEPRHAHAMAQCGGHAPQHEPTTSLADEYAAHHFQWPSPFCGWQAAG